MGTEQILQSLSSESLQTSRRDRQKPSQELIKDFSGGTVVKNPPANAGDMGSVPDPGRLHMPRSN